MEPHQSKRGPPHYRSQWEQNMMWRPKEEGKEIQATEPKEREEEEEEGDRYV